MTVNATDPAANQPDHRLPIDSPGAIGSPGSYLSTHEPVSDSPAVDANGHAKSASHVSAAPARPSFGKPFGFLIAFMVLGGAFSPIVSLNNASAILALLSSNPILGYQLLSIDFMSVCMMLAGLSLLISSTRRGWASAVIFVCLGWLPLFGNAALQRMLIPHPSWNVTIDDFLQQSPFFMLGSLALLLATPRLRLLYPVPVAGGERASTIATPAKLPRGLSGTWLALLALALLIPPAWAVYRFMDKLPAGSLSLLWDLRSELLYPYAPAYVFALISVAMLGLLLFRRRWSSIGLLIAFLWLAPTLGAAWFFYGRIALGLLLPDDTTYPAGLGFDWLAAMAWTAYLLEAPQVRHLYPGGRRYSDLVTDVDVF
ncbi:MAG TPA: hypothetical protein VN229_16870 [Terriglobales bacterium]|nr:hypothetical protein [Terriglobales bacterium]